MLVEYFNHKYINVDMGYKELLNKKITFLDY